MTRRGMRIWAVVLLLLPTAVGLSGWFAWKMLNAPLHLVAEEQRWIEISPGSPLTRVAADLASRGVLDHPWLFLLYARLRGDATRIHAGEYRLSPAMNAISLLDTLTAGRVYLHQITAIEGSRADEFLQALQGHPAIVGTLPSLAQAMTELGRDDIHPEGQFFPDTYWFPRGTTDLDILRLAYTAMQRELSNAWEMRADDLPLSNSYEALILASIIEKETRLESERPLIAGVFLRRLRRNMRLQTDPTVIYGLGSAFDGDLRRADLAADTPYNTYTRFGLPPTPISIPGRAALQAAVSPDMGDALYFVATGAPDGSHYFSATLEEHNAAVQRYLRRLRNRTGQ